MTQVSLSTSTNFVGDLNALVEDLGNALTVRFDLDEPAPEGGLKVFVDSNVAQIVNRLDLPGFAFNPITENINPALFGTSFDNSGFYLTIDEGATFGTFTIDVFDNPEPDTFLPETFDGLVEAVFELRTEVAPEDLADVGALGDYTIDPNAASSTVLFADDESQLPQGTGYDEAVSGDISGDPNNPLILPLSEGTTTLSATTGGGDQEYVTTTVPEGFQLDSLVLESFSTPDDPGFIGVQSGTTFTEPLDNSADTGNFLGYLTFGSEVGTDILDNMGSASGAIGFEGPLPSGDYTFALQQLTPSGSEYTLNFNISEVEIEPPPSDLPLVSLFTGPSYLIEDEGTVSAHAFLATGGVIPEGGLVVSVDAPNLSEFDLAGVSVEGGEIVAVRDGGFDLRMTEYTTLVNLPIADDGETEVGETATFSLASGEGYEIVEDYSGGSINLVDTGSDIPQGVISEPNNTIPTATNTRISPENPTFSGTGDVYFDIGNRYLNEDGTYTYIDYSEDVDVYKVELSAGDTVTLETSDFETNLDQFARGLSLNTMVFDAEGNQLRDYDGSVWLAAPDKLFGGVSFFDENETDSYQEFTAPEDGTYYFAFGNYGSVLTFEYHQDFRRPLYDPFTPNTGGGNRANFGEYGIEINLLTEENPRKIGTPTPPVSNPNVTNPPTLSLSANPATVDSEGNFTNAVVEHLEESNEISSVTFTIEAEGEIPEGGIEFVLNSDANLFDYVSFQGQNRLPETVGGQSLGAFYNEEGIPTGIRLLIEEPTMTLNYEAANTSRQESFFEYFYGNVFEAFEPLETDGAEDVTFFLQPGEGYEIAPDAAETTITYYDSLADVPPSTGGGETVPEVGVTVSETELIETEGTETTLTFTLSEPPPPEGLTVYLDSEDNTLIGSVLSQFDIFSAEISGGDFPVANGDNSGFFFNITEQTASITVPVFNELAVDSGFDPETFQEGIIALSFALQPQPGYTIDNDASEINFTIADNPDSQIQVAFIAEPTDLIESEGTVSIHTFFLSAPPPEEGLTVSVSADSLDDFDLDNLEVEGGAIAEVRDDGFDLTITDQVATISLPILQDGTDEGSETATFTLEPGDTYEINQAVNEVTFNLGETLDEVGISQESESIGGGPNANTNNIIPDATALGLSSENASVSINGFIGTEFQDYPEDVDFFSFNLEAGQTVSLDIDTEETLPNADTGRPVVYPAFSDILQKIDTELRLFDAEGNELAANNDGAAPGEEFSRDPFLEYTATESGTYYVGVSQLGNRNYDPFVSRSGSGWTFPEVGVNFGSYELTATLTPESESPIVSLTATPDLITEEEGNPLTLNFTTTGAFPTEGIIIATSALFNPQIDFSDFDFEDPEKVSGIEYFDFARTPEGEIVDLWTLTQPDAFIKLTAFDDSVAEVDDVYTLNLLSPEDFELDGYELDPNATSASVTISDGVPNLDTPSISISAEPTNLEEGDTLTVTLNADGDIPDGGLEINVDSDVQGAIGEFNIFDENGNFLPTYEGLAGNPEVNGDASGFTAIMTENTATITLSVFDDGPNEGAEELTFRLLDGENYGVATGAGEFTLTLDDAPELPVFGSLDGETFDAGVTPGFDGTDDIVFGGSGDDFIDTVAGNGGNRLYGQSGDDTFILGHNDRAFAGAGDDSFFLLGGNNVVTGGAGSDSFWLAVAEIPEAANTITDFDLEADVLGIAGLGIGFDGLTISEENGDTLIATGDDELAKLLGVNAGSLNADHFVFA
ncbi:hypothetical protein cce_4675 [Crocosphaera subtropica ATCC 51142]|uniref:Peptidase C-terminal archaeal/bacterial domain-containing protein n=1 Tax=Crocosphaera subtropica (strain ATCC 51142 / BH68) TaxID=43989 RepID=B1WW95_CROS5|nr:PPC domain-containing protein [Crocosphaera subtropica]ACB54023.1 hypothetical protein cce_4675 [Crocosphaera subtropica ATCC 51142]